MKMQKVFEQGIQQINQKVSGINDKVETTNEQL